MDLGLEGRVAIVTGGSKGIGKAIAESLIDEGVKVVICARGADSLAATQEEIRKSGNYAVTMQADVTKPDDVEKVVAFTVARFGGLDILVNNAGGATVFGTFSELEDKDWLDSYNLNVMSVVYFVRYAIPFLKQSQAPRIINIASISGFQPGYFNPHYAASKAAVINLSKYLANHLAKDKILVNTVCPGPINSGPWEHVTRDFPLGRIGEVDDVAGLVTFLASDKVPWITGSCFHVNGGTLSSI